MRVRHLLSLLLVFSLVLLTLLSGCGSGIPEKSAADVGTASRQPGNSFALSIVRHRWQVKIAESNHVAIRPGSVYDIVTYFEQNFGFPRPRFNYLFLDTGLGTADPIYPVFQMGRQAGWHQLLRAMWSDKNRHLDHQSELSIPDGCLLKSSYWVRHIDEFPDQFAAERAAGYTLVDISFNYYIKQEPDAQCGRHRAHDPDPSFRPMEYISQFADGFRSFDDIPAEMLARYEAKIGLLKLVSEEFSRTKWPRFRDVYRYENNSLWYYPRGFEVDYGINTLRPQAGLNHLKRARHMVIPARPKLQRKFPLISLMQAEEFDHYLRFINGEPVPDFDPAAEPGDDVLKLSDVSDKNFYTSGLDVIKIKDVVADVSDPGRYTLVSVIIRPYQSETDIRFEGPRIIPQLRFVYQLTESGPGGRPLEQLYLHLNFDAVDRLAPQPVRDKQHLAFLKAADTVTHAGESESPTQHAVLTQFLQRYTQRPVQQVAFSSSLSGIWVFGALSRSHTRARELEAVRIVREGVDVGYYSTVYDNNLFRDAIARSTGARKARLTAHLDELTPKSYRDPRRSDAHTITFERMTCAQCHQMAARDGVHVAFNDGLDRRFQWPVRATEFVYREMDRQLELGTRYWTKSGHPARR